MVATTKTKGSQQHAKAKRIRVDWENTYGRDAADLDLNAQEFRFTAYRPDISEPKVITQMLSQVIWRDEGNQYNLNTIPVMRGNATWVEDDPDAPGKPFTLHDGHSIRCDVLWFGHWLPLWEMRVVKPPERTVESGETTCELADDLVLASLSRGDFRYVKSKRRPHGWRYDQIVLNVCRRYRIPVAQMAKGTVPIKHLDLAGTSPLEVIRQAVLKEQEFSGRRHLIAWRWDEKGKRFALHILPARRNEFLNKLTGEVIRNMTVSPLRRARLATSVVAHGAGKKPKHGKRVRYKPVRESSAQAIKQYGFIERHVTVPGHAEGRGDLVRKAKRELADELRTVRIISNFITTGIATARRGDTMRVEVPSEGYEGNDGIVFITSVEHTITGGDYSMSVTFQNIDPFDPNKVKAEREAALRARKRAARSKHKGKK